MTMLILIAVATIEMIQKLKLELLPQSAYSPDLSPSDTIFLDHLMMHYMDASLQILKRSKTVHVWLCTQPKSFFANAIKKHVDQSNRCVEKLWDYIKNYGIFLCIFRRIKKIINCPF
jgi:hypothetical protein